MYIQYVKHYFNNNVYLYNLIRGFMESNIQRHLGKNIQKLRKINGYSQDVFAEKINIATTNLSNIETGKSFMTSQTLEKIAEVLKVELYELFMFTNDLKNENDYEYILNKLELIKNDKDRLHILCNLIKCLIN